MAVSDHDSQQAMGAMQAQMQNLERALIARIALAEAEVLRLRAARNVQDFHMPQYRSKTSTSGRNMAGARALWRATGMQDDDFQKPIIAVVNSFTQFVPGHVHLKDMGQLVARQIEKAGGVAKEFNTIAVDDGIAMGHDGMLYSLPSREIIADSAQLGGYPAIFCRFCFLH